MHLRAAIIFSSLMILLGISSICFGQNPRIINGDNAVNGQYPWMVALSNHPSDPSDLNDGQFCGGVLISPNYVLTAAHCINAFLEEQEVGSPLYLTIGRTVLSSTEGETIQAQSFDMHPSYDPYTGENEHDIAIIKLSSPSTITPIQLIAPGEESYWDANSQATAIGWGQIFPGEQITPDTLQVAQIPIHSAQECRDNLGRGFNPSSHICAGIASSLLDNKDGVNVCNGDSGGPLFVDILGTPKLVGLVSYGGVNCGGPNYSAFTNIFNYLDWIQNPASPNLDTSGPILTYLQNGTCSRSEKQCTFSLNASDPSGLSNISASFVFKKKLCRISKNRATCRIVKRTGFAFRSLTSIGQEDIDFIISQYYGRGTFKIQTQASDLKNNFSKILRFSFSHKAGNN